MQVLDPQAPATVTHDARPVLCDRPKRLQELVADAIAVRHYSRRTREAYWHGSSCGPASATRATWARSRSGSSSPGWPATRQEKRTRGFS